MGMYSRKQEVCAPVEKLVITLGTIGKKQSKYNLGLGTG